MKHVLFDFNGTLFQDLELHEEIFRKLAKKYFDHEITDEEFTVKIHGHSNTEIFDWLSGGEMTGEELLDLSERKEALYREICLDIPGFMELSEDVVRLPDDWKAAGVKCNIASAAPKSNMDFYIRHLGLDRWFDVEKIVCLDGGLRGKPYPDLFLTAAERLGVNPEDCIVFEDAMSGVEAAKRAGVREIYAVALPEKMEEMRRNPDVKDVFGSFDEVDREIVK